MSRVPFLVLHESCEPEILHRSLLAGMAPGALASRNLPRMQVRVQASQDASGNSSPLQSPVLRLLDTRRKTPLVEVWPVFQADTVSDPT